MGFLHAKLGGKRECLQARNDLKRREEVPSKVKKRDVSRVKGIITAGGTRQLKSMLIGECEPPTKETHYSDFERWGAGNECA